MSANLLAERARAGKGGAGAGPFSSDLGLGQEAPSDVDKGLVAVLEEPEGVDDRQHRGGLALVEAGTACTPSSMAKQKRGGGGGAVGGGHGAKDSAKHGDGTEGRRREGGALGPLAARAFSYCRGAKVSGRARAVAAYPAVAAGSLQSPRG